MFSFLLYFFSLLNYVQCANILGVFMFPSFSHQINYQPIWRELSLKGHQVTVVTPNPLNDSTLTNLTEIDVGFTYDIVKAHENILFNTNILQIWDVIFRFMDLIAESELNSTEFRQLIGNQSKQFDLVLIECFHPVMYGLAARFKAPIIGMAPVRVATPDYERVGNPTHPVLYPDLILGFDTNSLSLLQKIQSTLFNLLSRYYYRNVMIPRSQVIAEKYFGKSMPYLGDLEKSVDLLLINTNPLIHLPRPDVPAIVQLDAVHIRTERPLPQDLQTILDDATEGAIYFSLGSNIKSTIIGDELKNVILEALSELPYKILWKWESDHLTGIPDNVIVRKWFPQQDVIAHPNIKAFMNQGGYQSIVEAIYREVPLIGIPFMNDNSWNVKRTVDLGIGVCVNPATLTKDLLKESINEVVKNEKFKNKIKEVRQLSFDKQMPAVETAVWWTEYIIRHKGGRHLRSPSVDTSWFHYLLSDVLLMIILMVTVIIYVCYKLLS